MPRRWSKACIRPMKSKSKTSCTLLRLALFRLSQVLPVLAIQQFFDEFRASEFHQPRVFLYMTVKRHVDLPRARKHLGIVDCRFVLENVGADRRIPLHDTQCVAMEIS